MTPYPAYTASGIEWLGDIPAHWNFRKLKQICYMKGRIGWQGLKQEEFTDEGPYLITGMNFKDGVIRWNEVYHITEERYNEAPEIQLKIGDVLMTKDGTIGKLLYVDQLPGSASLNSHLLVLRPLSNEFLPQYLYYQLQSELFQSHIEIHKTGTTFYGITQEAVGVYKMLLPPLAEQEAIIQCINHKTRLIDTYLAKKQQQIERWQAYRAALINQAVTKGLHPAAPMKSSGIEWLGDIPAHWEVKRLKNISDVISKGTTPSTLGRDISDIGNIRFIKAENIANNRLSRLPEFFIDKETNDLLKRSQLQENDILFVIAGATLGKVAILAKDYLPANTNQAVCFIRLNQVGHVKFIWYWLQSNMITGLTWLDAVQSAQPNLSMGRLGNFNIPYPPLDEQDAIAIYLDEQTAKIDTLIAATQRQLDRLYAYRAALISAAVTGKMDVRGAKEA